MATLWWPGSWKKLDLASRIDPYGLLMDLAHKVAKAQKTRVLKGRFWRCLPESYAHTALESGPSFTQERRYSVRGEFGALYFSSSEDLAQTEAGRRIGDHGEPIVCLEFEVSLDKILDLTQEAVRKALGVRLAELVKKPLATDAYGVPQAIGRASFVGGISGLMVPSVHDPDTSREWFNLVLYPGNLVRSHIKQIY